MRVLFLGPEHSPVIPALLAAGDTVVPIAQVLDPYRVQDLRPDFVVSHGYRHIIREPVLGLIEGRAVNLHIALLPWNRGADPNLWSWLDETPKGVTIHYINAGVDTGDIIAQREVLFAPAGTHTLQSTYAHLQDELLGLFVEQWPLIRSGRCERTAQAAYKGSYHSLTDGAPIIAGLPDGWRSRIADLEPGVWAYENWLPTS